MYSVGHQLMKAREARCLSIEDVAFQTRIPHQRLRDMENDDLSNFANLTYAKGFLKLYSKFLDLDLSDYLDEFDTSAISDVTGHEYMLTANAVRSLKAPTLAPDETPPRGSVGILGMVAATVMFAAGGWIFLKSREPANPAPSTSTPTAAATPAKPGPVPVFAAATPAPSSRPQPAPALPPETPPDPPDVSLTEAHLAPALPASIPASATPDRVLRATIVEEDDSDIPVGRPVAR